VTAEELPDGPVDRYRTEMLRVVCFKKMRGVLLIASIASHPIATAVVVVRSAKLRVEGVTDESANGNTYPSIRGRRV
jgi:hypothetical protein